MARPIVALARNPDPNTLPWLFSPIRSRTGPFTTRNGAVPVVLCQIARGAYPSATSDSQAARTTGKYSGRQPARAALMAASRTVQLPVQVRHRHDHLVRVAAGQGQELGEVGLGDGDHGQAVGPAPVGVVLHGPADLGGVGQRGVILRGRSS